LAVLDWEGHGIQEPALSLPKGTCLSRASARVVLEFDCDFARVERTLLSAAFDFDLGFELLSTFLTRKGTAFSRAAKPRQK
jgi:hypothetical protein